MFKGKKDGKKALQKFLKEYGLDGCAKKMADLGVEKVGDLVYITEAMISAESNGFNPIQQQKLRSAIEASKDGSELGRAQSTHQTPSTPPANKTSGPHRKASGETGTSRTNSLPKARSLYDYTAQKDGQLDLKEDDIVSVVDSSNKWWDVIHSVSGVKGKVPSNYMELIDSGDTNSSDSRAMPSSMPDVSSLGARPDLPDEEVEAIYEPVDHLRLEEGDDDEPEYEDPDAGPMDAPPVGARKPPPRPNMRRSESVKVVPEAKALDDDPQNWNSPDVLRWLESKDLKDFCDVFYANGFEGPMLLTLSSSSFKAGGFDPARCAQLQIALDSLHGAAKAVAQARVLYDYDATKNSQLSIVEGEVLEILDESSAWWKARNSAGKQGQVPSNYLEKIVNESAVAVIDSQKLDDKPWFCDCDRTTAESKVRAKGVGAYLVRPSQTSKGDHTLTAMGEGGIMNLKIQQRDSHFVLGQFSSKFTSIVELIDHHNKNEIKVTGKPSVVLTKAVR
eukprot:m.152860 g.152860  ORF g.152860 m.152860 type:complete len:505 (-) comp17897_c0_seq1:268-1782(-)